jgi:hypothetical protein
MNGCFPVSRTLGVARIFEAPDDLLRVGLGEHHIPGGPVPHLAGVALVLVDPQPVRDAGELLVGCPPVVLGRAGPLGAPRDAQDAPVAEGPGRKEEGALADPVEVSVRVERDAALLLDGATETGVRVVLRLRQARHQPQVSSSSAIDQLYTRHGIRWPMIVPRPEASVRPSERLPYRIGAMRTSKNSVMAKFAERLFYEVRLQRCNIARPRSNA